MILYRREFDADSLGEVAMEIGGILRELVGDGRGPMFCIRELADNAIRHSGTGEGICLIERYEEHLHVVIRDGGLGIHHRMGEAYGVMSESTAVRWAFGGISGTTEDTREFGLPAVLGNTQAGMDLLLETGGVAYVGTQGHGHLIGKSTQEVQGVMATLTLPPQMLRPSEGLLDQAIFRPRQI